MFLPVIAASVTAAVKAAAATFDHALERGNLYEVAVTADTWIRQRRASEKGDAEAGKPGSMLVFKGRVITLHGDHGAVLSLVRDKTDGLAVLTPLAEV